MKRREFLQLLLGTTIGAVISGCGGGGASSDTSSKQAVVQIDGKDSKIVDINSGETVLDAIKKAFSYKKQDEYASIIDGISNSWRYSVNGIEPEDIYAGDYALDSSSTIYLRPI